METSCFRLSWVWWLLKLTCSLWGDLEVVLTELLWDLGSLRPLEDLIVVYLKCAGWTATKISTANETVWCCSAGSLFFLFNILLSKLVPCIAMVILWVWMFKPKKTSVSLSTNNFRCINFIIIFWLFSQPKKDPLGGYSSIQFHVYQFHNY